MFGHYVQPVVSSRYPYLDRPRVALWQGGNKRAAEYTESRADQTEPIEAL